MAEGQVRFQWVQDPNGQWVPAQIGPEPFAVRVPGCEVVFASRDFMFGEIIKSERSSDA